MTGSVIKPADKGGSLVVKNRKLYLNSGSRQLQDERYYKALDQSIQGRNTGPNDGTGARLTYRWTHQFSLRNSMGRWKIILLMLLDLKSVINMQLGIHLPLDGSLCTWCWTTNQSTLYNNTQPHEQYPRLSIDSEPAPVSKCDKAVVLHHTLHCAVCVKKFKSIGKGNICGKKNKLNDNGRHKPTFRLRST